MVILKLKVNK